MSLLFFPLVFRSFDIYNYSSQMQYFWVNAISYNYYTPSFKTLRKACNVTSGKHCLKLLLILFLNHSIFLYHSPSDVFIFMETNPGGWKHAFWPNLSEYTPLSFPLSSHLSIHAHTVCLRYSAVAIRTQKGEKSDMSHNHYCLRWKYHTMSCTMFYQPYVLIFVTNRVVLNTNYF